MSKKRVHEIAKELKEAHGIELDNKAVVEELKALGIDVRSHSSSVEADQANEAIKKIADKRAMKVAPPAAQPKGFVVRRKVGEMLRSTVVTMRPAASEPTFVASPPEMPTSSVPVEVPPAPVEPPPAVVAAAPLPETKTPPPVAVPPPPAEPPAAPPVAARPKPLPVAPTNQMPTATQAVLVNRPLIPIKRVTPNNSRSPSVAGRRPVGEVREFRVVPNQPGVGTKEFVDATRAKEKEQRRPAGQRREKEKEGTASNDIRELIFGRVAIPIRGKKKKPTKKGMKTPITEMAEEKKFIKVQDGITIADLSQRMGVKASELIKKLMGLGKMATANQVVDVDTATLLAVDFGWTVKRVGTEVEDFLPKIEERPEDMAPRPPVVTVMGHVDHGKTSLLDAIRTTRVAAGESGGITQHIGAYTVSSSHGDITFLDTPGHEAFSAMRARGANLTDVVVLVVAADDGVMPQTKEAISHAQAAEVPVVVAVNKIDLPAANLDRVKKELADAGLLAEDWGGDAIIIPVSAKTKQGLELLLESISLQAEVLELRANPKRPAVGTVIEARLEKGRGPVATVLVQEGTLRKGDAVVSGICSGRARMMFNDRGEVVQEVLPGYSAELIGLSLVPVAGDTLNVVADEKAAKQIVDHRLLKLRQADAGKTSRDSLESLLSRQKTADQKELKLVLKADVSGSLEAVADALNKLSTKKVKVTVVQKGVGMMTETDISNAHAFGAVIIGFNSKPESGAELAVKQLGVRWNTFSIIYELLDGVTLMMEDLLDPIRTEKKLGRAEVRTLFNVPRLGVIAGSAVVDGVVKRTALARILRENKQVFEGKITSLKRFKDDVREVTQGYECGIGIEGYAELQAGDIIEVFEVEETRPSLN